jgi:hypothetical protein
MYENMGADFSACVTNEELLSAIEAYEDMLNTPIYRTSSRRADSRGA